METMLCLSLFHSKPPYRSLEGKQIILVMPYLSPIWHMRHNKRMTFKVSLFHNYFFFSRMFLLREIQKRIYISKYSKEFLVRLINIVDLFLNCCADNLVHQQIISDATCPHWHCRPTKAFSKSRSEESMLFQLPQEFFTHSYFRRSSLF
jgi:hypothetical protein